MGFIAILLILAGLMLVLGFWPVALIAVGVGVFCFHVLSEYERSA